MNDMKRTDYIKPDICKENLQSETLLGTHSTGGTISGPVGIMWYGGENSEFTESNDRIENPDALK